MKPTKGQSKFELPKATVPKPLRDVYRELRGQHLLPLVALLVASLIAIPLLLKESTDTKSPAAPATASGTPSAAGSTLTATTWHPGLRKYQDRLSHRNPKDPFTNGLTAADFDSSAGEGGGGESGGESPPAAPELPEQSEPPVSESGGPAQQPPSGGSGPQNPAGGKGAAADAIDVEIVSIHEGIAQSDSIRYQQPPQTKLPSTSVPALTYLGTSDDGTKAIMRVSPQVTSLEGKSNCIEPGDPCKRLALELKEPETLVFGPEGRIYQIVLLRFGAPSTPPGSHPSKRDGRRMAGSGRPGSASDKRRKVTDRAAGVVTLAIGQATALTR